MATYDIKVQATTQRDIIVTADTEAEACVEAMREMKGLVGGIEMEVMAVEEITDE